MVRSASLGRVTELETAVVYPSPAAKEKRSRPLSLSSSSPPPSCTQRDSVDAIGRAGVLNSSSSGGVRFVVRSRAMPSVVVVVAATAAAATANTAAADAAASSTGPAVVVHSPLLCARCVVRDLRPSGSLR